MGCLSSAGFREPLDHLSVMLEYLESGFDAPPSNSNTVASGLKNQLPVSDT